MSPRSAELVLGGTPRVELLPPEVAIREKARGLRRIAVFVLVLVLVAVVGGYALLQWRYAAIQQQLSAAQSTTQSLITQKAKYSKVTTASSLVTSITEARQVGASTEVLWSGVLGSISASLPAGVSIESATMKARAPWEPELVPAGPLREPLVATLSIVISSPTIFDATAIVRSLASIPGFADATPDSVASTSGKFSTTITLDLDKGALSNRFAATGANK